METRQEHIAALIIRHSLGSSEAANKSDAVEHSSSTLGEHAAKPPHFRISPCHGGCISVAECFELEDVGKYFVKSMSKSHSDAAAILDAEVDGLLALEQAEALRVPKVLARHRIESESTASCEELLVLEYLEQGRPAAGFFESFGRRLADLHRSSETVEFGWRQDNFIGRSPQYNQRPERAYDDWPRFFAEMRIQPQLNMLQRSGSVTPEITRLSERLMVKLPELLATNHAAPSLLHGDLWNGNFLSDADGRVAIFDPAVYHGHRECEFALPFLFGGFPSQFYESYQESFPMENGWRERVELYQLYHLLNHANLFGDSYLGDCLRILRKFA
ncbi:MAG: fructosamine kinase family protein [Planctomycetota bacterium]